MASESEDSMHAPQLPGNPHLVTLAYLLGLILLAALGLWIWQSWRARQETQRG